VGTCFARVNGFFVDASFGDSSIPQHMDVVSIPTLPLGTMQQSWS
jgi:hypothetical protein